MRRLRPFISINLLISWNYAAAIEHTQPALYSPEGVRLDNYGAARTHAEPSPIHYELGQADGTVLPKMQRFFEAHSTAWEVRWDKRSDRPNLVQGVGMPMLPGTGNSLTYQDVGVASAEGLTIEAVEGLVRGFMTEFPEVFDFPQDRLKLVPERSGNYGKDKQLWFVDFQQVQDGIPVRDASMVFRINNGNLIQFGMERIAPVQLSTMPALSKEDAFAKVLEFGGFSVAEIEQVEWERAGVEILPTMGESQKPGEPYTGSVGQGYLHALVWRVSFRRVNDIRRYEALVDAHSGEVLQLGDTNDYLDALVQGGVHAESSRDDPEVLVPLPYVLVQNNGPKYTNELGTYNYQQGYIALSNLIGKYVKFRHGCAEFQTPPKDVWDPNGITLTNSTNGNLSFGTHMDPNDTNCTTPGVGGYGNTHAARNSYYHLTMINRKSASYFNISPNDPNHWLNKQVTSYVNYYPGCGAGGGWIPDDPNDLMVVATSNGGVCTLDGVTDTFRSTGELADAFLHEFGHIMDDRTGGFNGDGTSREAFADTLAMIHFRNGCMNEGYHKTKTCYRCRISCAGRRDIFALSQWGSINGLASPSNVISNTSINCDRPELQFACDPNNYTGMKDYSIMGYERHCESYIVSTAVLDPAKKLIDAHGTNSGWSILEQIWFDSVPTNGRAFRIFSGGKCNPNATIDGCGPYAWYKVYLAVDDDDGNLINGTPNGCRIYDAFTLHGIGCEPHVCS